MTTSLDQGSATIYQFPVGGRRALGAARQSLAQVAAPRVNEAAVGSSWYHEEAIRESERASEH